MANSLSFESSARTALALPLTPSRPVEVRVTANTIKKSGPHGRELFLNHVWESLNAGAKILFFALITPMMLSAWGTERFGLFALANSCVALMACLDLGLRMVTRVGLTNPQFSETTKLRLHALNFVAFAIGAGAAVTVVAVLAAIGCWHRWLHLPQSGDLVIALTALLTVAMMSLQLLVEPIAAAGHLSRIKAALFVGNLFAFGIVVALLHRGASVATVTAAYLTALGLPLLFLLANAHLQPRKFLRAAFQLRPHEIVCTLRAGGWINLITTSWVFQSYALVLLISWMMGPAAAGAFFLFLKLADALSVLGASASEPTIAALAGTPTVLERHRSFAIGYKSAIALCATGAVGYSFFCNDLFRIWLHRSLDHSYSGLLIGLFGVATGFNRMVASSSIGLGKPRPAALGLLAGTAFLVIVVTLLHGRGGLEMILAAACLGALFLLPAAVIIARELGADFTRIWLQPVVSFAPQLGLIILVCWGAAQIAGLSFAIMAALISAGICAQYIFRRPTESTPSPPEGSFLGYDTRSWCSAFVMKSIDLLNPFPRQERFSWRGPCVISSVAGLGDLFIHLPLIAGLVNEARQRGVETRVALRPTHAAIGQTCGWNVLPFDNSLEDFFKNPSALKPSALVRQLRDARKDKANLWIDLTGSAVSALAIKLAGTRKIAARVTRGGRGFINHPLPHALHENEYSNVGRVAQVLGCELDYGVFERLRGEPLPGPQEKVVLCLTTVCRWKNWPLRNFLALVDRFPKVQFAALALSAEVAPEESAVFTTLLRRPNVTSLVDTTSILQLIHLIAHARAVITNDTSTAHIANAFRKPGAVFFGPTTPDKWASPGVLKSFVDRTCPFHPCVQWTCRNQENWCMRKVQVGPVADHLAAVLESTAPYAATASVP